MASMSNRVKTVHHSKILHPTIVSEGFEYLRDTIEWMDGVRSKKGATRQACPINLGDDAVLDFIVLEACDALKIPAIKIGGIYLNYYRNGDDWCPNHTHKDTRQMIISLGATRLLLVGSKIYPMEEGDVIIFGTSVHGVPKQPECKEARISIAVFLAK